jgi:hypothetical protein
VLSVRLLRTVVFGGFGLCGCDIVVTGGSALADFDPCVLETERVEAIELLSETAVTRDVDCEN